MRISKCERWPCCSINPNDNALSFTCACIKKWMFCDCISFNYFFSYDFTWLIYLLSHLFVFCPYLRIKQVQEKKVKKISDMNVDPKAMGNGSLASSSNSSSSKSYLANGVSPDGPYNYLSNDFSFPPGGIPSLRLPLVVVFSPFNLLLSQYLFLGDKNCSIFFFFLWTTQKLVS